MKEEKTFFDDLRRKLDFLDQNANRDNEASRHDLLIYPVITNISGLGWNSTDIISQTTINVPKEVSESHIFRGAIPKVRRPDLLICPAEIIRNFAVIEEKNKQSDLAALKEHRVQLSEYQSLFECNWGILTDGEKWLIKKGFETLYEFSSIYELEKNIKDFRNAIGSTSTLNRYRKYKNFDLIIVSQFGLSQSQTFPQYQNIPVIVVGVKNGEITPTGLGYKDYANLKEALLEFPDLHPELTTKRFTWALKEFDENKNIERLRFETWKAYDIYSN